MQQALSEVHDLTFGYSLDRTTINSQEVANRIYDDAEKAFGVVYKDERLRPLRSAVNGLSKHEMLQRCLAVFQFALILVKEDFPYPNTETLERHLAAAEQDREKLQDALQAVCEYSGVPTFDDR